MLLVVNASKEYGVKNTIYRRKGFISPFKPFKVLTESRSVLIK